MQNDKAKLETKKHGFEFLEELCRTGVTVDYGELTANLVNKYRVTSIEPEAMEQLLLNHINQKDNLCLYFGSESSSLFCLNLDNNYTNETCAIIPEMKPALAFLREHFHSFGIVPLIIESGRGYHLWCRVDSPVANERLHEFLLRISAFTMASLHDSGINHNNIKFTIYPDPRTVNHASLRLFGSKQIRTERFSFVTYENHQLDEADSWKEFERYLTAETISIADFISAHADIMEKIP